MIDVTKGGEVDDHGAPCVSTLGVAELHLHAEKVLGHAYYEALGHFCNALLAEVDTHRIRQGVAALVRSLGIFESSDEPLASMRVARLEAYGGVDVFERLKSGFEDSLKGLDGFRLLQEAPQAYRNTLSVQLERNLTSELRAQCRRQYDEAMKAVHLELDAYQIRLDGTRCSQRFLASLLAAVSEAARFNAETARAVADNARPNQRVMADIEEQAEALAQQNGITRTLMFLRTGRLARTYLLAAVNDLRCRAELSVRAALDQHLYRPLLAAIGQEAVLVDGDLGRFGAMRDRATADANTMANLSTEHLEPVGLDLATADFCARKTAVFIAELGGPAAVSQRIFQLAIGRIKSLTALREQDLDAAERILIPICQTLFEDKVRAMDVLEEFRQEFRTPEMQRQVVQQLVHEASGRLVVNGEADRPIPWIKIAGFGNDAGTDWFQRLLRDSDHEVGTWHACKNGDRYTVTLLMFRAGISLEGHLRQLRHRLLQGAPPLTADSGADPVISQLPSADPSPEELAGTIVRGLAAGAIKLSGTLWSCFDSGTDGMSLGGNPGEVRSSLINAYTARLELTLEFVRALAFRHEETLARLKALRAKLADGDGGVLRDLIDEQAVKSVEQGAADLWPYLKRLPILRA